MAAGKTGHVEGAGAPGARHRLSAGRRARGQGGGSGEVASCLNTAASPWCDWFYSVFWMTESLCVAPWGVTLLLGDATAAN